jgi:hypothetical protein
LKRNFCNRIITLQVCIWKKIDFQIFNEVERWINSQQENIKLQFKLELNGDINEHEDLNEFLKSNCIKELKVNGLTQELARPLFQKLRRLVITDSSIF